ncbi:MAG: polymorphic toxin type 23 domain-containing protein [Bacteroidia bacterium]
MQTPKTYAFILLFSLGLLFPAFAQFRGKHLGLNVGAVMGLGNKFQRIGFSVQGYYFYRFAQVNAEIRVYHNLKNLGPKRAYSEAVAALGSVLACGQTQNFYNPFLSSVSNQTRHKYSVGYSYNFYFNKVKTTQQTGIVSLQFGSFSIISENDLLARPVLDRFRTGAVLLQYQHKGKYQAALNCTMWTGQMGHKVSDADFPNGGYMDTTGGVYTSLSHGLLSAQFKTYFDAGQILQANVGIDAEQVRNFVQNRLIHDLIFLPKKWPPRINYHVPMIDPDGRQYLYKPEQHIRKPELYWNVFNSPSLFY